MQIDGIDVYPVGWLEAWQHRRMPGKLRSQWRYTMRRLRRRDWRAFKNSLNGYLAEVDSPPWPISRCGHGWTKKRAINDLMRHMTSSVFNEGKT